ncbi:MAG: cytidylate kinase-like family protein, partial [Planctomycetota bacterium]
ELARSQRLTVPQEQRGEVEDCIAICRLVGARGGEIASRVGEALGWPVFDKDILGAMAEDDAIRQDIYSSMDERDVGWAEEVLRTLVQPEVVKNDYFHRLTQTVLSISRQGHAVFLGRAIDYILPKDRGLRVRLVAPKEQRVQTHASASGLGVAEALAELTRIDRERTEFVRQHFHVDPTDPTRCDLTLSLERLSISDAVELILAARQQRTAHR